MLALCSSDAHVTEQACLCLWLWVLWWLRLCAMVSAVKSNGLDVAMKVIFQMRLTLESVKQNIFHNVGGPHLVSRRLQEKKDWGSSEEDRILPADCLWIRAATSALPCISRLLAYLQMSDLPTPIIMFYLSIHPSHIYIYIYIYVYYICVYTYTHTHTSYWCCFSGEPWVICLQSTLSEPDLCDK